MAVDPVAAARYFIGLGCTAFPVWGSKNGRCNCGDPHDGTGKHGPDNMGKHPATNNGFKDGVTDLAAVTRFLGNPGTPNYGLTAPPGVLIVDVDGEDGIARWDELQHRHGPLPVTLTTTTANGRHYFYRWPDVAGPMPSGKLFGFVVRRHDDGYVIGPGSVHPKGVVYDTLRQPSGHPYAIADLPMTWATAALKPTTIRIGGVDPSTVQVGGRHDTLRDHARFLVGTIRDPEELLGAMRAFNQKFPVPKSDIDVRKAIGEALERFPADQVVVDEEGNQRAVRGPDESRGIYALPDAERFPAEPDRLAFGGLVGDLVADLATGTDASEVGLLASVLAFCGVLYPATGHFGRGQSTGVYMGLVGPSTEGRKGTAMSRVSVALSDALGHRRLAQVLIDGLNSGEGLVTALETKAARDRTDPVAGLIFEEEFRNLLAAQNRDNSTLDTRMRTAWDGTILSNRKQAGSQSVEPPYWVSALAAITPQELRDNAPKGATTSGSFNRWLWLPVIRRDIEVMDVPPDVPMEIRAPMLEAFHSAQRDRPFLRHTPDAQRLLSAYSGHLSRTTVGLERDLSARLTPLALRIGMIHAMVEGQREVTRDHVSRGVALAEYARSGIAWVFGFMVGDEISTHLLRALQDDGVLTKNQITQEVTRDPVKRQRAIDELQRYGFAEVVRIPTSGRPRIEVRLVSSRPLSTPFVQSVHSHPFPATPLQGTHESQKTHETQVLHEMHERGEKPPLWLRPCHDYTAHRDHHRNTPKGWVCIACAEEEEA